MSDFFRGGGKLPWWAVTGSIIATVISAVTFVAVPSRAWREDGDFTYLQLGLIAGLTSRLFVAFVLVPAYYRYNVYSPYDYMARRLGESARTVTTACFTLLGLLGQAARVYLTAVILELVLYDQLTALQDMTGLSPIAASIIAVGLVSVVWTMLGGMATVVWTDALLFLVFVTGGVVALGVIVSGLPGGVGQLLGDAYEAGKFKVFNFDPSHALSLTEPFTLLAAFIAVTLGSIGSYGTDQLTAQRIFCCRNQRDAQKAMLASYAAEAVVALMLMVGVGLWLYYKVNPDRLFGEGAAKVAENPDNIFPVFILTEVPMGLTGLIIAGIFAAAISSLTSILAALAQTSMSAVLLPIWKIDPDAPGNQENEHVQHKLVRISRGLIVFWGVALCALAFGVDVYVKHQRALGHDVPFLDLALGLASYVIGTLLAAFVLAWLPLRKDAYGLIFSAPLSVMMVWAARFHHDGAAWVCSGVGAALVVAWVLAAVLTGRPERRWVKLGKTLWVVLGGAALVLMSRYGWFASVNEQTGEVVKVSVAWPWYAVIGAATAFAWGYVLAEPYNLPEAPPEVPVAAPSEALL